MSIGTRPDREAGGQWLLGPRAGVGVDGSRLIGGEESNAVTVRIPLPGNGATNNRIAAVSIVARAPHDVEVIRSIVSVSEVT